MHIRIKCSFYLGWMYAVIVAILFFPNLIVHAYGNGFSNSRSITIDHTKVPNTDQTNFPVLISGTYSYLATVDNGGKVQNSSGYDIGFYTSSDCSTESKMAWETETYTASTGAVNYWVKVPTVATASDTVFYICYGNTSISTDQSTPTSVWGSNYKGVWHFPNGSSLSLSDSTSNARTLTNNNSTSAATGKIDGGATFNGQSQYLSVSDASDIRWANIRTVSFWVDTNTTPIQSRIMDESDGATTGWSVMTSTNETPNTPNKIIVGVYNGLGTQVSVAGTPANSLSTGWHFVHIVTDGTVTSAIYIDGVSQTLNAPTGSVYASGVSQYSIGRRLTNSRFFSGELDDVRINSTAVTADWITTEFNNQSSPSTFYALGSESSDTTAPTVSLTSPSDTATVTGTSVSITASASDNVAVAGVQFKLDTNTFVGSEDTTSTYGVTWDSGEVADGTHTLIAVARDDASNRATSTAVTVTVKNTPTISSGTATPDTASTTISWTTDIPASSRIYFGLTQYGTSTSETNTSTRVTNHAVTLFNLIPCTRYNYKIQSKSEALIATTSSNGTFYTTGCTGSGEVASSTQSTVTVSSGGTISYTDTGSKTVRLVIPTGVTAATTSAIFQVNELDKTSFQASAGAPTGKSLIGSAVYNFKAYSDATTTISSFDSPITVTLSYTASDVTGIDESTLAIYRYDGVSWNALSGCSTDTGAKTVSCATTSFSDFSIVGTESTPASSSSTSSSGGGGNTAVSRYRNLLALGLISQAKEVATQYGIREPLSFTRNLMIYSRGDDVRELQQFLNTTEFPVAQEGPGSKGNETTFFGRLTRSAVIKFQKYYNITPSVGTVGPKTRGKINEILQKGF